MRTTPIKGWQNIVLNGESVGKRKRFDQMLKAEGIFE
jgi:hypothetical protein